MQIEMKKYIIKVMKPVRPKEITQKQKAVQGKRLVNIKYPLKKLVTAKETYRYNRGYGLEDESISSC
jgi:hypothetical protein